MAVGLPFHGNQESGERESQLHFILTAARPRISLSLDDGEMLTVGNWRMQLLAELTIERSEEG